MYRIYNWKLIVINTSSISLTIQPQVVYLFADIQSFNLKKGVFFNPDPYLKLSLQPGKLCEHLNHHKKEFRTGVKENTTSPRWDSQVGYETQSVPYGIVW